MHSDSGDPAVSLPGDSLLLSCLRASAISLDSVSVTNWLSDFFSSGICFRNFPESTEFRLLELPFRGGGSGGWLFLFFRLPTVLLLLLLLPTPSGRKMTVPAELVVALDKVLPLPNNSYSFSGVAAGNGWPEDKPPEMLPEAELIPDERSLLPPLASLALTDVRFLCKLPSLWPSCWFDHFDVS